MIKIQNFVQSRFDHSALELEILFGIWDLKVGILGSHMGCAEMISPDC
jgi:hypothetical protein